jgi:hypothetical protein
MKEKVATEGRIGYMFNAFCGIPIIFIEVKEPLSSGVEYFDAVA